MKEFLKWFFSLDAPEWVQGLCFFGVGTGIVALILGWGFLGVYTGSALVWGAPFGVCAFMVWREYDKYKRDKTP